MKPTKRLNAVVVARLAQTLPGLPTLKGYEGLHRQQPHPGNPPACVAFRHAGTSSDGVGGKRR